VNRTARTILVYLAVIFVVVMAFQVVFNQATQPEELTLNEFASYLEAGEIEGEVVLLDRSNELTGTVNSGSETFEFTMQYASETSPEITVLLQESGVEFRVDGQEPTLFMWFLTSILPYLLIFGLFIFIIMQMQGGGNRVMQFAGLEGYSQGDVRRRGGRR